MALKSEWCEVRPSEWAGRRPLHSQSDHQVLAAERPLAAPLPGCSKAAHCQPSSRCQFSQVIESFYFAWEQNDLRNEFTSLYDSLSLCPKLLLKNKATHWLHCPMLSVLYLKCSETSISDFRGFLKVQSICICRTSYLTDGTMPGHKIYVFHINLICTG